jgi:hypothetical protein
MKFWLCAAFFLEKPNLCLLLAVLITHVTQAAEPQNICRNK